MSELYSSKELLSLSAAEQAAERQSLLDDFAERPDSEDNWQTAYAWVRAEGDYSGFGSIAADIPGEELIAMAAAVRQTPTAERYSLMAGRASNGKYWFDVVEGFSSNQVRRVQAGVVKLWAAEKSAGHFDNVLDVGTGVGKSLAILEGCAVSVVGLDQNAALLRIAQSRAGLHTKLVQGSAEKLPFTDSSFDLVSSQGLRAALDKSAATAFLQELARVMTPTGLYIEGHYYSPDEDHRHPELARFTETSKAMLSDMIGDTASGALDRPDRLSRDEEQAFLAELGLSEQHYDVLDDDGTSHTLITVITR